MLSTWNYHVAFMDFRSGKRGSGMGIDMAPMIDCVFQLLVFFLLSSSFLTPALNLKLPRAQGSQPGPAVPIAVSLDAEGRLLVNQEVVAKNKLREHLAALFGRQNQHEVVLRAHKNLAYETVVGVIQTIQRAGGQQVHLAYEGDR